VRVMIWVALGGGLGAALRYLLGLAPWGAFPWDTLLVNGLGCLVIGWVAIRTAPDGAWPLAPHLRQFLMTGVCGGFTTFSVFSLETLALLQDGAWLWGALYVGATLLVALLGAAAGIALARD